MDAEEFETLYRGTARELLAFTRRRTPVDPDALVAEVYVVAWRRRSELPAPHLRRAWLYGVARRLLLADARVRSEQAAGAAALALRGAEPEVEAAPADDPRVVRAVAAAMARLDPDDRDLLRLAQWEDLTPADIAVVLGIRAGAARVRLHRARQRLAADPEVRALLPGDLEAADPPSRRLLPAESG